MSLTIRKNATPSAPARRTTTIIEDGVVKVALITQSAPFTGTQLTARLYCQPDGAVCSVQQNVYFVRTAPTPSPSYVLHVNGKADPAFGVCTHFARARETPHPVDVVGRSLMARVKPGDRVDVFEPATGKTFVLRVVGPNYANARLVRSPVG